MLARILLLAATLAAAGCATAPLPERVPADLLPAVSTALPSATDALAPSDAMRRFLAEQVRPQARLVGLRQALLTALFEAQRDGRRLRVEYEGSRTRTAAETFDERAGNCLSLVLMTASLARELGLPVSFQAVETAEGWTRSGGLLAYSGHINLVLGSGASRRTTTGAIQDTPMLVDFLPPEELRGHRVRLVDEATVLGMYLNNRAAEALAAGRADEAAAWVAAALARAPQLVPAWNTLALLHRRQGDEARAERALGRALQADPYNTRILANLVALLQDQGRDAEATPLRQRLVRLEPDAPFAHLERGIALARAGRWAQAQAEFEAELQRDPTWHEAHWWLAQAAAQAGDLAAVRRHLQRARDHAPTSPQQALYAGKLQRLSSAGSRPAS